MLTVLLALCVQDLAVPELRAADLDAWREHIRPAASEIAFEQIPWIDDFVAGIRQSDEEKIYSLPNVYFNCDRGGINSRYRTAICLY